MIKAVCNSSPIIGLSIIQKLDLLWKIFDEIYVPREVFKEVTTGNRHRNFGEQELKDAVNYKKILIYEVQNPIIIEAMLGRLHRGELEVIQAAKELDINTVIIDDKAARKRAKDFLLKPIGLIGILQLAKEMGKIPEIKSALDMLIKENYRISKQIYNEILIKYNEIDNQ